MGGAGVNHTVPCILVCDWSDLNERDEAGTPCNPYLLLELYTSSRQGLRCELYTNSRQGLRCEFYMNSRQGLGCEQLGVEPVTTLQAGLGVLLSIYQSI